MSDDGNRTEKGVAPAPSPQEVATADTIAPSESVGATSASRSLPALDRERYAIEREVGRGGLGRILRARDQYLDRPVAVKELLDPDAGAQARFVREALITARLQHPAIVPIYDAGHSDDKGPFYAMKLVAGKSLHEKLAEKKTFEGRLELLSSVIAVVDAMAYAHNEKIIHRDLKPQNVLVGDFGETVLIDWGLAKDLSSTETEHRGPYRASSSSLETVDGAVIGTPAFMPPEQAAGEDVDARADVYALGAMLYFLISGLAPHGGRSMDEMLVKIVEGDIIPVQIREPRCPTDLAAIVAKAMAIAPADRYPSAKELADDLKKFQTGQLVGAHEYTLGERFRRWLKKHRGIVAVATAAFLILATYGVWSLVQIREREEEALAQAARATANEREANAQRDLVLTQSMLVRARQYAATGHTAEELAVLRALATGGTGRKLAIEDGGLIWKAHQRLAMALGKDVGYAYRTADGSRFMATEPGALVTWDAHTGQELSRMPIADPAAARFGKIFAISPAGRYAIVRECAGDKCGVDIILDGNVVIPRAQTTLWLVEVATAKKIVKWDGADGAKLDRRTIAFAADDNAFAIRNGKILDIYNAVGAMHRNVDVGDCTGALAIASSDRFAVTCKDVVQIYTEANVAQLMKATPTQLVFVSRDRLLAIGEVIRLFDVLPGEIRGEGKLLQAAQREDEEEAEELPWTYFAPGAPKGAKPEPSVPEISVGHTTSIVARTSILSPPPRTGTNGAVISLEGHDWQALAINDDYVRYALVDQLVPAEPPERCLSRVGGERHATTAFDNGERLLIDQQEVALGLAAAPPEGYRHTTTGEVPVRQLRPLVAAEVGACLVWGSSVGARKVDGGLIAPLAGVAADGHGGLVVAETRAAYRIDRDGKRTALELAKNGSPLISPSGAYVASVDPHARTLVITQVATGKPIRTWTAPPVAPRVGESIEPRVEWIAKDVIYAFDAVVSLDPAVAPRPYTGDLVTDPRTSHGAMIVGTDVIVQDVASGKQLARHAGTADRVAIVPDDTARVIIHTGDKREVVDASGKRITLANLAGEIVGYDVIGNLLVAHQKTRSDAWDLATGQLIAIPSSANLVAIIDDVLWLLDGPRKTTLVRMRRDGSQKTEVVLQTPGLPFHQTVDSVTISDDRKRITARYAVNEELFAQAIWDTETGVLLWIGPPTVSVTGDWIVSGGHAYIPMFDVDAVLRDAGTRTNLRVCKSDLRVVPVTPPPAPETVWAPDSACAR